MLHGSKFIQSVEARALVLHLPKVTNEDDFFIINTYAPPDKKEQVQYCKNLKKFLNTNKISSSNSIMMGDMNDYSDNLLDRWSTKGYSTKKQDQGKLLATLKKEKYVDIFRTIHSEQRVYS